jgi:hypothetical protein
MVTGGYGIEQQAQNHHQEQVERNKDVPLDADSAPGPLLTAIQIRVFLTFKTTLAFFAPR